MSVALEGADGRRRLVLRAGRGQAEVHLHGATLTSYRHAGRELLFLSDRAVFDGAKAIRGGVPLVFPQFGQPRAEMPQHGLLRTATWTHRSTTVASASDVEVLLATQSTEASMQLWPHAFSAELSVRLSEDALRYTLRLTNADATPLQCHALLHSYLSVPDVRGAAVEGLRGVSYVDKLSASALPQEEAGDRVEFTGEVDRVYVGGADGGALRLLSEGRELLSTSARAWLAGGAHPSTPVRCDVVVWNPWTAKAASMADLGEANHTRFVCIEPGPVADWVSVAPGEQLCVEQTIAPAAE